MKTSNRKAGLFILAIVLFASAVSSYAGDTSQTLDTPFQYCYPMAAPARDTTKFTFGYNYLVDKVDQGKDGYPFFAFRDKSGLWLRDIDGTWYKYEERGAHASLYGAGPLPPVMYLPIVTQPMDVTGLEGDILVGYGLKETESSTIDDAFQWMVTNNKYSVVWSFGSSTLDSGYQEICLDATKIETKVVTIAQNSGASQNKAK